MASTVRVVTPPTAYAISLERARHHLFISHFDDDQWLLDAIADATGYVEGRTGYVGMTTTIDQLMDAFPSGAEPIVLRRRPVQSITYVQYTDSALVDHPLGANAYVAALSDDPPRIAPATGTIWPSGPSLPPINGVAVRAVVGSTDPALVSANFKQAVLAVLAARYDKRTAPLPEGLVDDLLMDIVGPLVA